MYFRPSFRSCRRYDHIKRAGRYTYLVSVLFCFVFMKKHPCAIKLDERTSVINPLPIGLKCFQLLTYNVLHVYMSSSGRQGSRAMVRV